MFLHQAVFTSYAQCPTRYQSKLSLDGGIICQKLPKTIENYQHFHPLKHSFPGTFVPNIKISMELSFPKTELLGAYTICNFFTAKL